MIPFVGYEREIVLRNGSFRYRHAFTEAPDNRQHKLYGGNGYQLLYLLAGDVKYQVEGTMLSLEPGDLLLINNWESHRPYFTSHGPFERIVIFFKGDFCSHFDSPLFSVTEPFALRLPGTLNLVPKAVVEKTRLFARFMEIEEQMRNRTRSATMVIELTFLLALVELVTTVESQHAPGVEGQTMHRKVEEVMVFVRNRQFFPSSSVR